jgi:hypothetical protein
MLTVSRGDQPGVVEPRCVHGHVSSFLAGDSRATSSLRLPVPVFSKST